MTGSQKNNSVAVVRMSALGDVALAVAAVYDAALTSPGRRFWFVTKRAFAGLCVNAPANLTVVGADTRGVHKGLRGIMRLAREIIDADTVVDLHDVLRSRILDMRLAMKGKDVTVFDKARQQKRILTRLGAVSAPAVPHTFLRYRQALQRAGVPCEGLFRGLFAQTPADSGVYASLSAPKTTGETWIGIAPFAAHEGKVWPPERMLQVVRTLQSRPSTKVFLFGGGKEETETLQEWAAETGAVCVAGSKIGFGGELALMNALDVMVSMDSGNMHLAAIAGTSTVSIWGQTHPHAGFGPWEGAAGTTHLKVGNDSRPCRPCSIFGNRHCHINRMPPCLTEVDIPQVMQAIDTILTNKSK